MSRNCHCPEPTFERITAYPEITTQ